jgi:hypothetical protein
MVIRGGRTTGCKDFISAPFNPVTYSSFHRLLHRIVPHTTPFFRLCRMELFIPFTMPYSLIPLCFSFSYLCSPQQQLRRGQIGGVERAYISAHVPTVRINMVKCIQYISIIQFLHNLMALKQPKINQR